MIIAIILCLAFGAAITHAALCALPLPRNRRTHNLGRWLAVSPSIERRR